MLQRTLTLVTALVAVLAFPVFAAAAVTTEAASPGLGAWAGIAILGATLGTGALTLLDAAKRTDPKGNTADIVEMMKQDNPILDDIRFMEGNLPTGERTTIRTGLPDVYWRLINQGTPTSKSRTVQVDEQVGMLEAWSEVDTKLVRMQNNPAAFRLSEARAFIQAMGIEFASTLFYGSQGTAPEEFTGLAPRYSSLSAENADNIIDAGGTGSDNASIWLVSWGDDQVRGIYPKGSKAGIDHKDHGEAVVETVNGIGGSRLTVFRDQFNFDGGLVVKDWRYAVRICNIDVSDRRAATDSDLIDWMETAVELMPDNAPNLRFYMNRTMRRLLRTEARRAVSAGGGLNYDNFEGKRILMFDDIPIRRTDALLNTEARVT